MNIAGQTKKLFPSLKQLMFPRRRLIYCEKPSTARAIAGALGIRTHVPGGFIGFRTIITWGYGSMFDFAGPEHYGVRPSGDAIFIPEQWDLVPRANVALQIEYIRRFSLKSDELVIATDCDEAGELIGYELVEYLRWIKPVLRLLITDFSRKGVQSALGYLLETRLTSLYYARAILRKRMDWILATSGAAMVRRTFRVNIPVGRAILPALSLIVEREKSIRRVEAEQSGPIQVAVRDRSAQFSAFLCNKEGRILRPSWDFDLDCFSGTAISNCVLAHQDIRTIAPPAPYTLTELMADSSEFLSISAQKTSQIAQHLYDEGAISYPRVSRRQFTGAGGGILTVHEPNKTAQQEARQIFRLIHVRETASSMLPAKIITHTWIGEVGKHACLWRTYQIIDLGWARPYVLSGHTHCLPIPLRAQPVFSPSSGVLEITTAFRPIGLKRFTEASLLRALANGMYMTASGRNVIVGSDASRAPLITSIVSNGYAELDSEQHLVPTKVTERALARLPPEFVDFCAEPEASVEGLSISTLADVDDATRILARTLVSLLEIEPVRRPERAFTLCAFA